MVAPVFQDATLSSGSGTSSTVTMPATRNDGDFFVCIGAKDDNDAWTGIDAKWNEITQISQGTQQNLGAWWWVGASEPASYSISHDNEITEYCILRYTGASGIHGTPTTGTGNSANGDAPDFTPTLADTAIIRGISVDRDAVTATQPTEDAAVGGGGANDVGLGVSHEAGPAADTAAGTAAFTHATDEWSSITIAIIGAVTHEGNVTGADSLDGVASLTATATNTVNGVWNNGGVAGVTFTATNTVNGSWQGDAVASVTFTGQGIFIGQVTGADSLDGVASITFTGDLTHGATVALGAVAGVTFTGTNLYLGVWSNGGVASVTFVGTVSTPGGDTHEAIVTLACVASINLSRRVFAKVTISCLARAFFVGERIQKQVFVRRALQGVRRHPPRQ
jgi:hypothetical protein